MSLLDDVSIVVTPNGYKAGELYAVVPVPTEGAEEISCGDFECADPDAVWTRGTGWTISGGSANCDGSQTGTSNLYQYTGSLSDKIVKITFTISNYSAGYLDTSFFGASGTANARVSANGDYIFYISIQSGHNGNTGFSAHSSFIGSIDNVSVKEYTSADMDVTRATAATRVDENGLVNYAEVLGSELAICGDFECASPLTGWSVNSDGAISIDNGRLKVLNVTNRGRVYRSYTGLTIGKTYEAFVGNSFGSITGFCHITSGTANNNITLNAPFFFIAGATTADFQCGTANPAVGLFTFFDNISLKQNDRDNVPRIDYTGGGCPHILAEPQRTNLIPYSEDLTNAFYLATGIVTVTESTTLSPDGTSYGYTITPNSSATNHYFNYNYGQLTVVIGDEVTYSIFVKPNGYNFIQLASSSGFPAKYQNFELTGNGVIGTGDISGKTIEKIGDWYRCSVTETAVGVNPRFLLSPSETALATRNPVYSGNGTDGVLGWGVQVEVGSYETSYIPTSGSTVTRNQDQFTRDGIGSLINSTEGCVFGEGNFAESNSGGSYVYFASLSDGTVNNRLEIRQTSGNVQFLWRVATYQSQIQTSGVDVGNNFKFAVSYSSANIKFYVNGNLIGTINTPTLWSANTLNRLAFDDGAGGNRLSGKVKQLQVYKTALTDEQLIQLTGESGTDFYESYAEMAAALNYTIQ